MEQDHKQNEQYRIVDDWYKPKDAIKLDTVPLNKTFPEETVEDPGNRVFHYLQEGSDRAFVCEELMHFSEDTQVPPDWVSEWK